MSKSFAIKVENLTKIYKLYDSPQDRIKESLHPLRKKYHKEFYALNDVSFEIRKGETVGIIGQNGAGKSTLLKTITGVLTPSSGSVAVNGRISALLELGAGFNPQLTGLENIYFNGTIMGYTHEQMDVKLDEILDFADIGDFVYQPVKTYSSGMFVRLAFAVAVHIDPEILIVDEALSVGDMMFQAKCYDRIKSLMSGGVTTLFVTHNMNTISSLCNRVYMFDGGMVHAEGPPKEVTLAYFELQRRREHERQERVKKAPQVKAVHPSVGTKTLKGSKGEVEHRFGSGEAEIVEFKVFDHEGNETVQLATGQKFTIRVKVYFHDDVDNFAIGAMIRNTQGQNLLGIHSFHDKRMVFGKKAKGDELSLMLESGMLLNPGKYTLSLGVADFAATDYDYKSLDSRNNVAVLEIFGKSFSYGIINNNCNIQVVG